MIPGQSVACVQQPSQVAVFEMHADSHALHRTKVTSMVVKLLDTDNVVCLWHGQMQLRSDQIVSRSLPSSLSPGDGLQGNAVRVRRQPCVGKSAQETKVCFVLQYWDHSSYAAAHHEDEDDGEDDDEEEGQPMWHKHRQPFHPDVEAC